RVFRNDLPKLYGFLDRDLELHKVRYFDTRHLYMPSSKPTNYFSRQPYLPGHSQRCSNMVYKKWMLISSLDLSLSVISSPRACMALTAHVRTLSLNPCQA